MTRVLGNGNLFDLKSVTMRGFVWRLFTFQLVESSFNHTLASAKLPFRSHFPVISSTLKQPLFIICISYWHTREPVLPLWLHSHVEPSFTRTLASAKIASSRVIPVFIGRRSVELFPTRIGKTQTLWRSMASLSIVTPQLPPIVCSHFSSSSSNVKHSHRPPVVLVDS